MILMLNIFLLYYILLSTKYNHRLKEFLLQMVPLNNSNNNFPVSISEELSPNPSSDSNFAAGQR